MCDWPMRSVEACFATVQIQGASSGPRPGRDKSTDGAQASTCGIAGQVKVQ